jgi:hypothetical protein
LLPYEDVQSGEREGESEGGRKKTNECIPMWLANRKEVAILCSLLLLFPRVKILV